MCRPGCTTDSVSGLIDNADSPGVRGASVSRSSDKDAVWTLISGKATCSEPWALTSSVDDVAGAAIVAWRIATDGAGWGAVLSMVGKDATAAIVSGVERDAERSRTLRAV